MRPSLLAPLYLLASASARRPTSHPAAAATASAFLGPILLSSRPRAVHTEQVRDGCSPDNLTCISGTPSPSDGRDMIDPAYPGTAVQRMRAVRERVGQLSAADLGGPWKEVRRKILWAGGLRDLPNARPGLGNTSHSFNDWNHVDLTCMSDGTSDNLNDGTVQGIAVGNHLGEGIRIASLPELGPGGSWSTCALGCGKDPPQDVAHLQFRSRIAFKLVWVPNADYDTFVLVDDDGNLLARGTPSDGPTGLPPLRERVQNYRIVQGSKYARAVDAIASGTSAA